MPREQRVVAELGRPETPEETAARKAESSRIYRGSQSFRNLIAALLATLAILAIVIFGVPRGEIPQRPSIDPTPIAADVSESLGRPILVPAVPTEWRVNSASVTGAATGDPAWTIVYVPDDTSFLRVGQSFDNDEAWARSVLSGFSPTDTVRIDGIEWDVYDIADPSAAENISYALGTQAGTDHVLIYGTSSPETTATVASSLTEQIRELDEGAP